MKDKILYWLAIGTILLTMGTIFYVFYLLFYPFKTFEVLNSPFPLVKKELKRGEAILYRTSFCRYTDISATIIQQIINETIISLPIIQAESPKGCFEKIISNIKVPSEISSGKAYLNITFVFKVNPLRDIIYTARTEEFTVID